MITGNTLNGDLEDHHIFPYSLNKSGISKNKLNSIANRIIVSKVTNRNIGDSNPDKYLVELANHHRSEGNTGDLDRRLSACFIPYSSAEKNFEIHLQNNSFEKFLEDRAQLIVDRIKEVVGDAWKEPIENEDANIEDDEFVTS